LRLVDRNHAGRWVLTVAGATVLLATSTWASIVFQLPGT
jgi:hypothetical protein